jgi:hypothetical protein
MVERRYRTFYDTLEISNNVTKYRFFYTGSRSKIYSATNVNYDSCIDKKHDFLLTDIAFLIKPRLNNKYFDGYWINAFNKLIWNSVLEYKVCGKEVYYVWKTAFLINCGVMSFDENMIMSSKINVKDYDILINHGVNFCFELDLIDANMYDYRILNNTSICMNVSGYINNDI